MNDLAMALTQLCRRNRDGSQATQANRLNGLKAMAAELYQLGFRLPAAASLKPKHVAALIAAWEARELSPATMKNRLGWLRWWAEKVNKASVIPRENAELGIATRTNAGGNRAWQLEQVRALPDTLMQMSLQLMAAFGLRMEEALKLKPRQADAGHALRLQGSWTKGARARDIPIRTDEQRQLLAAAKELVGGNSLIPTGRSYIQHRKAFEHQTLKHGLTNLHGLRHGYAQARYRELTGWPCPKDGGPAQKELIGHARALDRHARLIVAEELGHSRISITTTYLG
ncbi:MAG: integrase [Hyphomicrobiales bacterium]|nr:MAG: integrase [Hyphomicrobiales bacterium]